MYIKSDSRRGDPEALPISETYRAGVLRPGLPRQRHLKKEEVDRSQGRVGKRGPATPVRSKHNRQPLWVLWRSKTPLGGLCALAGLPLYDEPDAGPDPRGHLQLLRTLVHPENHLHADAPDDHHPAGRARKGIYTP